MLSAYREFLPAAPRELTGFFAFHFVPPGAAVPGGAARRATSAAWSGTTSATRSELAKLLAPILAVGTPLMHGVHAMPFATLNGAFDGLYPPGDQWYWRADFVKEISDEAVELPRRVGREAADAASRRCTCTRSTAPLTTSVPHDTPWGYRDARWGSVMVGVDPDPAQKDVITQWSIGLLGGAAPALGRRRLREHDDGRGPGPREGELPRQLRAARARSRRSTTRRTSSASTRTSSRTDPDTDTARPRARDHTSAGAGRSFEAMAVRGELGFAQVYEDDYRGWPLAPKHGGRGVYGTFLNPTTVWPSGMPFPNVGYHQAIDIPVNDAAGAQPVFAVEGGRGPRRRIARRRPRRSARVSAPAWSASATSATRTSCRASRWGTSSRPATRSAGRPPAGGTSISRSSPGCAAGGSISTRFDREASSLPSWIADDPS